MFFVTLMTAPNAPILDMARIDAVRTRWAGGDVRWLKPGVAAEFAVDRAPLSQWEDWAELQAQGIDMALVPAVNRRKKVLLADMDSTMIQQECIDELADMAGVGAHVSAITARAMNGELDFEAALRERVGLLKDLPVEIIDRVIRERITFMPGGATLIATMKAQGAQTVLVSGGFVDFTRRVAGALGFDENRANTLLAADGRLTGEVAEPILGRQAKIDALEEVTARLRLSEADVIAVGDGANDLGMLGRAGMGVALHAKPAVAAQCALRVNHGDLTALLFLQGYAAEEFVHPA